MTIRRMVMGAVLALGLSAAPALAQAEGAYTPEVVDPWTQDGQTRLREIVTGYLDQAQAGLAPNALRTTELPDEGALILLRDSPQDWTVFLKGGVSYVLLGACDDDCTNLDLELIDANNRVVAADTAPDDFPIVRFRPTANATYTVRTHVRSCAVEPCQIGVRILIE